MLKFFWFICSRKKRKKERRERKKKIKNREKGGDISPLPNIFCIPYLSSLKQLR